MTADSNTYAEVEVRLYRDGTGYVLPRGFDVEPFEIREASLDAAAERAMRFVVERIARPRERVVRVHGTTPDSTVQLLVEPTGTVSEVPPHAETSTLILPGTENWWRVPAEPVAAVDSPATSPLPSATAATSSPSTSAHEGGDVVSRKRLVLATGITTAVVLTIAVSLIMVLSPNSDNRSAGDTSSAHDNPKTPTPSDPQTPPMVQRSTAKGPPEKKAPNKPNNKACKTIGTKRSVSSARIPRVRPGAFSKPVHDHSAAVKIGQLSPAYVQKVPVRKQLVKPGPNARALSVLDPAPPATSCTGVTVAVGYAKTRKGQPGTLPGLATVRQGTAVTWTTKSKKIRFTVTKRLSMAGSRIPSRFLTNEGAHRLLVLISTESAKNGGQRLTGFLANEKKGNGSKSKKGNGSKSKKGNGSKSKKGNG